MSWRWWCSGEVSTQCRQVPSPAFTSREPVAFVRVQSDSAAAVLASVPAAAGDCFDGIDGLLRGVGRAGGAGPQCLGERPAWPARKCPAPKASRPKLLGAQAAERLWRGPPSVPIDERRVINKDTCFN